MKVTLITTLFLFVIGTPGITFGKSRLDRVDCGSRMSRLDAGKCEKIRLAKQKARTVKEDSPSYSNPGYSTPVYSNPGTIKGEWDSKGRHYTPAGGNNL